MGGFFAAACRNNVVPTVFFGTDYHSHLGTKTGGMAIFDKDKGFVREIHTIDSIPFRTKFEKLLNTTQGYTAMGTINDTDPQPLLIRSNLGTYAINTVGIINNSEDLIKRYLQNNKGYFNAMTGGEINSTELTAALINQKDSFAEGIQFAQEVIDGTSTILILTDKGTLIAARDKNGRLPVLLGKCDEGYCISFESFSYQKLGFDDYRELAPGEIVEVSADGVEQLKAGGGRKKICAFLWTYYGFPTSCYEGTNVEVMRYRNGEILARNDKINGIYPDDVDYVSGVPDSGTPHAIGYAHACGKCFARPFIKYTPTWLRSFMPENPQDRSKVAKMKQIPVPDLIHDKNLLFVDDSIVRGTQLRETVDFLYNNGARSVHIRSACPPILRGCKYLNFSRTANDMELITRKAIKELEGNDSSENIQQYADGRTEKGKAMRKKICNALHCSSLDYQSLDGMIEAIGLDASELCTYCWSGIE